jgi:hypothetical protein
VAGSEPAGDPVTGRALRFLLCVSLIAGCATVTRVQPGSGSELTVEGRSYDEVWRAAVKVVSQHVYIAPGTDKGRGEIQAASGGGRFLPDQVVGVFIRPPSTPSDRYVVEVVSGKRRSNPLPARNWEQTIIAGLKKELGL